MFAPVRLKETGTAKLERKGRRIQNHAAKRERVRDKDAEGRAADPQGPVGIQHGMARISSCTYASPLASIVETFPLRSKSLNDRNDLVRPSTMRIRSERKDAH
jgi:hypothetical protein